MNYNAYEAIYKNALRGNEKANLVKSFEGWRKTAVSIREAVMTVKKFYKAELAKLWEQYKADAYFEGKKPLDAMYNAVLSNAQTSLRESLQGVLNAKREQLSKCLEAPSDADLRLLSALNLRTSLTESEVAALAEKLNGNIHSLKALHDIAEKSGISFPNYGDIDDLEHELDAASQFAESMIRAVDADMPSYFEHMFFAYADEIPMPQFEAADGNFFISAQENPTPSGFAPADARPEIPAGKAANAYRVYLNGTESLVGIANQFNISVTAIRRANPGVDIHHLDGVESIIIPTTAFTIGRNTTVRPDQMQPTYIEISGDGDRG